MFARASIASGLLRRPSTRYSLASGLLGVRPKKKKRKFICYVPFMWQAMTLTLAGILLIFGGVAMCTFGYFADNAGLPSSSPEEVTTADEATVSASTQYPRYSYCLRYLIYVGPVLMGSGCFLVVVASVVVCETRDKILDIVENQKLSPIIATRVRKPKPDFFRLVVSIGLPATRRSRALSLADDDHVTTDDRSTQQKYDVTIDTADPDVPAQERDCDVTRTEESGDCRAEVTCDVRQHFLVDRKPRSSSLAEPARPKDFEVRSVLKAKRLSVDSNAVEINRRSIPQIRTVPNVRFDPIDRIVASGFDPSKRRSIDSSVKRVRLKLDDIEKNAEQEPEKTRKQELQQEEEHEEMRENLTNATCRRVSEEKDAAVECADIAC